MDRAERIADAALCMAACLEALIHRDFNIAQIVERIKDADNVHAVFHAFAHKAAHRIIRIMMISEQILSAQQHLQFRVLQMRFDFSQALPRVLIEVAQATVEGGAAPAFNRMIAGLIHLIKNRLEIIKRHTGCDQRLLCIAQHSFGDMHSFQKYAPPLAAKQGKKQNLPTSPFYLILS